MGTGKIVVDAVKFQTESIRVGRTAQGLHLLARASQRITRLRKVAAAFQGQPSHPERQDLHGFKPKIGGQNLEFIAEDLGAFGPTVQRFGPGHNVKGLRQVRWVLRLTCGAFRRLRVAQRERRTVRWSPFKVQLHQTLFGQTEGSRVRSGRDPFEHTSGLEQRFFSAFKFGQCDQVRAEVGLRFGEGATITGLCVVSQNLFEVVNRSGEQTQPVAAARTVRQRCRPP